MGGVGNMELSPNQKRQIERLLRQEAALQPDKARHVISIIARVLRESEPPHQGDRRDGLSAACGRE